MTFLFSSTLSKYFFPLKSQFLYFDSFKNPKTNLHRTKDYSQKSKVKSQKSKVKSQQLKAISQQPTAKSQQLTAKAKS